MDFSESRKIIEKWRSKTKPLNDKISNLNRKVSSLREREEKISEEYSRLLGADERVYDIPKEIVNSGINTSQLRDISNIFAEFSYKKNSPYLGLQGLLKFIKPINIENANLIPTKDTYLTTSKTSFDAYLTLRFFKDFEDTFNYLDKKGLVSSDIPYDVHLLSTPSLGSPKLFLNEAKKWSDKSSIERVLKKEEINSEGIASHVKDIEELIREVSKGKKPLFYHISGRGF